MSCSNCGSKTAGCGCTDTAYTTPKVYTCPPDTSCPQPVRCSEFMDAACIFLNDGIADAGIQPGSSLESIIQQLILLVTNPGCVDAPGGVPGGGTVTFINAVWPGNAITIAGGPITNAGTFVFNGNGTSNQYIDGQGNLQTFPAISAPVEFQTNGTPNSTQVLLNLVAGTGITLTESGGSVTIDADANIYTVDNGLSADPTDPNNFQLGSQTSPGAPLIHDTYIAGSQYRFEINNTNSMYLQGNRVDIESAAAGAMMLSTGGAADSSVEVTGTQVAIESVGTGATRIFLDPAKIKIQTPLYSLKNNNDVLTLIDKTTGEVEYMPVASILLQTDGTDNGDQALLNLVSGNGITLTNVGGDVTIDGPLFQTDGTDNSVQTLLNLVAGTGITLTESAGSVTIDAAAPGINLTTNLTGGGATYDTGTGDLNIPIYQSQIDIQEEGGSVYTNPQVINFIGTAVTATPTLTGVDVTITGAEYISNEGIWKEITSLPETFKLGAPIGSGNTIPFQEDREVDVDNKKFFINGAEPAYGTDGMVNIVGNGSGLGGVMLNINSSTGIGALINTPAGYGYEIYQGFSSYIETKSDTEEDVLRLGRTTYTTDPGYDKKTTLTFLLPNVTNGSGIPSFGGHVVSGYDPDVVAVVHSTYIGLDAYDFTGVTRQRVATFIGEEQTVRFDSYGAGNHFGPGYTPTYILGVGSNGDVVETTVAGLTITVDTAPFSSSTLIDFTSSADINITDLGGGLITFDLANPPVTYDSNEGVWNDSDVFKLGAPTYGDAVAEKFTVDRYIYTDTKTLQILGVRSEEAPTYIVNIVNEYTGDGGSALQLDHYGSGSGLVVYQDKAASANTGMTGVYILASNQPAAPLVGKYTQGINIQDITGNDEYRGLRISSGSTNTLPIYITRTPLTGGNTIEKFMVLETGRSTIVNGIGGSIDFKIHTSTYAYQDSNRIITKWFDSTNSSRKSQFEIQGSNSGTVQTQFTILGGGTAGPAGAWSLTPGQIKFDRYAAGAIYKSATDLSTNSGFNLGIDADGNIWATDFSTGTGGTGVQDISIGTLSNGASATVSNPTGPSATINITGQNAYTQISADTGTASANVYNSLFSVVGANGVTTSVSNGTMPTADIITVTGPNKYLSFVTKNVGGTTIATYTPATWNDTLNIQAGSGITITNGGSPNTIVISGGAGTGTVSNVTGVNANGFTVGVTNGTTTPAITVGTSINGVLVGNGTSVSAVSGTGVMVFSGTGYTFQALPTVNDGQLVLGANAAGLTNTSVALVNSAGGAFTANKATNSTYLLQIGPAIANLVTLMTAAMPVNPAISAGATTALPPYIIKTGQDTYTVQTPVTTFSPGSTGFTVTSLVSSATTSAINGAVVLGGTLNVASGGTGTTTAPGPGQILVGNGSGGYTVTNITGGTGITVTNGSGTLQISATGITPSVLNGVHIHTGDGSIRLGSGTTGDTITPLIELTDVRLNGQIYRVSNNNNGYITQVGFQIDDSTRQGFFGSSASTSATTANVPQVGFMFTGDTGTPLATYNGVYIDRSSLAGVKVISGFSSGVTQTFDRAANTIYQQGPWGGGAATSKMYEVIPASRTIQFGDISAAGGSTWFKLDDALSRIDINKGTIYDSAYGGATPLPIDGATTARYLLATASNGKFYEIDGRSISQITGNTGTFSSSAMASSGSPVAFSIQGSGTISTSIAGNVLTISNSATAFPYWSTLNLTASAGGTVVGDANVIPNTVGANTLNLVAGNGITLTGTDSSNTIQISAGTVNAWYNIAVAGQSNLVPDAAQDTLTFAAGTGIQLTTNATTDTLTITSTGITSISNGGDPSISVSTVGGVTTITGNYNSNNGIFESGGNTFQLGAPTSQTNALATVPFTEDRFINGNTGGFKLDMQSPVAASRGVLHLTATAVGRALRAVNTNTAGTAEGAIYAFATMDASPDATPTGTIYAETGAKGHAVVGVSPGTDPNAIAAIFGTGRQGVKGYTTASNGIGVYGHSETGLGVGVQGTAVGGAIGSYGGSFSITDATVAKQEVVKITKVNGASQGAGALTGYYIGVLKKGQVGYISDTSAPIQASQYEATVVDAAGTETVRHRIESTGQQTFSAYATAASFPLPIYAGNQYRGITLTANTGATGANIGKVYTTRIEYGDYNAGVVLTSAPAGTLTSNQSTYSLNGKFATVQVSGTITYTTLQSVGTRTLTFSLPAGVNFASSANNLFSWNTFRSTTYFSKASFAVTTSSVTVTLTIDTAMPANFVNEFYINLTYITA